MVSFLMKLHRWLQQEQLFNTTPQHNHNYYRSWNDTLTWAKNIPPGFCVCFSILSFTWSHAAFENLSPALATKIQQMWTVLLVRKSEMSIVITVSSQTQTVQLTQLANWAAEMWKRHIYHFYIHFASFKNFHIEGRNECFSTLCGAGLFSHWHTLDTEPLEKKFESRLTTSWIAEQSRVSDEGWSGVVTAVRSVLN